jgi:mevalonate kinase
MAPKAVQARAPGKIILIGEHAALHGCPVFATALGLYCTVRVWARDDDQIEMQLPDLHFHRHYSTAVVLDYVQEVRRRWACLRDNPNAQDFSGVRGSDIDHLAKCAVGEILCNVALEDLRGFTLRVQSSIPLDAGFGSSAALAVSLSAALQRFFNLTPQHHPLHSLAMCIERYQHGFPSGIDHNTSLMGGMVERRPEASNRSKLLLWPSSTAHAQLRGAEIYHTGAARESTGHVIAATRHRLEGRDNPLLASMQNSAERFRTLLQSREPAPETLKYVLRNYEAALECLGVVPEAIVQVIRAVEAAGGAAKICGAGALSGDQAGALLVVGAPALPALARYRRINAPLAVAGLEVNEQ